MCIYSVLAQKNSLCIRFGFGCVMVVNIEQINILLIHDGVQFCNFVTRHPLSYRQSSEEGRRQLSCVYSKSSLSLISIVKLCIRLSTLRNVLDDSHTYEHIGRIIYTNIINKRIFNSIDRFVVELFAIVGPTQNAPWLDVWLKIVCRIVRGCCGSCYSVTQVCLYDADRSDRSERKKKEQRYHACYWIWPIRAYAPRPGLFTVVFE